MVIVLIDTFRCIVRAHCRLCGCVHWHVIWVLCVTVCTSGVAACAECTAACVAVS